MKRIIDQLILIIYSFTTLLLTPIDTAFLISFLMVLIYSSVNYFSDSRRFHFVSTAFLIVLSFFFPSIIFFLPAVIYNCVEYKNYFGSLLFGLIFLIKILPDSLPLFLVLVLGCCIAFLLVYQTEQYENLQFRFKQTRDDSTELNLLLKEKNQVLLEKQDYEIYTATLKERNRIAREIHDNVGHMLSRSILMTGAMKTINKDSQLQTSLLQLEETLNAAMTNVRESVHDLHDDSINLKETIQSLADTFTFCPIQLDYDMGYDVPREIKYSFITIIKEALNNVMRHSNASKVYILVREHPGLYQLAIEDNGTSAASGSGLGLVNMKDRVDTLKGTIQIRTEKGFRIFITIPKKEN